MSGSLGAEPPLWLAFPQEGSVLPMEQAPLANFFGGVGGARAPLLQGPFATWRVPPSMWLPT